MQNKDFTKYIGQKNIETDYNETDGQNNNKSDDYKSRQLKHYRGFLTRIFIKFIKT